MQSTEATVELSSAQRIFKVMYYVSIPPNMIDDTGFEAYRGSNASGSSVLDKATLDAPTKCHLPIWKLANVHHLIGASGHIYFSKPSLQSVEIYRALVDHISSLKKILEKSYRRDESYDETVRDLQVLDDFAGWVWKVARNYIKEDELAGTDSLEHRGISRRMPMSRGERVDKDAVKRREADRIESEHTPIMQDYVESEFVNRRGGWIGG